MPIERDSSRALWSLRRAAVSAVLTDLPVETPVAFEQLLFIPPDVGHVVVPGDHLGFLFLASVYDTE